MKQFIEKIEKQHTLMMNARVAQTITQQRSETWYGPVEINIF
jgi:hypothetical protein